MANFGKGNCFICDKNLTEGYTVNMNEKGNRVKNVTVMKMCSF